MKVSVKLPRIGMNMQEATIVTWHKQPGDAFKNGEVLFEFETEKVNEEFAAEADGTLVEIKVPEGEDAEVGDVVAVVDVAQ